MQRLGSLLWSNRAEAAQPTAGSRARPHKNSTSANVLHHAYLGIQKINTRHCATLSQTAPLQKLTPRKSVVILEQAIQTVRHVSKMSSISCARARVSGQHQGQTVSVGRTLSPASLPATLQHFCRQHLWLHPKSEYT